jgi:hydroxylamine reductase
VRLGPTPPAFLTPALLDVLVQRFGVQPITTADADLEAALQRRAE